MKALSKSLMATLCLCIVVALSAFAYRWYAYDYPYTNNAYVDAPINQLNSSMTGRIASIAVKTGEYIKQGQLLLTYDDKAYRAELLRAKAKLLTLQRMEQQPTAARDIAKAVYDDAKHLYKTAKLTHQKLVKQAASTNMAKQQLAEAKHELTIATAQLTEAKNQYQLALQVKPKVPSPALINAQAEVDKIKAKLTQTKVYAPYNAYVSQMNVHRGAQVQMGSTLLSLVDTQHWWIKANFRETILRHLHPGQPVDIKLAMYPDKQIVGEVERVGLVASKLSRIEQSWLPVNSSYPVIIKFYGTLPKGVLLRVGAHASVKVDVNAVFGVTKF